MSPSTVRPLRETAHRGLDRRSLDPKASTPKPLPTAVSAFIRNIIGAASSSDLDAVASAVASAREMREAAEAVRALAERAGVETAAAGRAMESEVARLTARLEAMPEMRAQLEQFVQSLGRTMTGAADRLDSVDDRMHHLEQQSRAQSELLSLARTELDRQGRVLAEMAPEVRALLAATERLSAATDRTEALVREVEERKVRVGRTERVALVAAAVAVLAAAATVLRMW